MRTHDPHASKSGFTPVQAREISHKRICGKDWLKLNIKRVCRLTSPRQPWSTGILIADVGTGVKMKILENPMPIKPFLSCVRLYQYPYFWWTGPQCLIRWSERSRGLIGGICTCGTILHLRPDNESATPQLSDPKIIVDKENLAIDGIVSTLRMVSMPTKGFSMIPGAIEHLQFETPALFICSPAD